MTKNSKKSAGKRGSKGNIQDVKLKSKNDSADNKSQKDSLGHDENEVGEILKSDDEIDLEVAPRVEIAFAGKTVKPSESLYSQPPQHLACTLIESYEGQRGDNDEFSGYGIATFVGGNVYEGGFCNGVMHGRGKYKWVDGTQYEGDFDYNQISGFGRYEWPDNSFYEGDVLNSIRHGVGVFKNLKQDISYSGQWRFGKRHGKAVMYYSEHSWYKGDWVNNVRHGWGVRRYETGNVYEGQWVNGKRHGEGTMRWLTSNESYTGMWKQGIQHGCGTHTWYLHRVPGSQYLLRNEYVGEFVNSLRHGKGKFFFASGAVYSGEWKDNKKHGWGKFIFKNGRVFEGQFENDHMVEHPEFTTDGSENSDTKNIRTRSPIGNDESNIQGVLNMSMFGPGVSLDLGFILKDFEPEDHMDVMQQLSYLLLRNVSVLRRIYSFYSGLGHDRSPDNTFVMTRFQFWRFLKDTRINQYAHTLSSIDCLLAKSGTIDDIHNPMQKILLREFLNSIVVLSYTIFKEDKSKDPNETKMSMLSSCFRRILNSHILKNSCKVGGNFLYDPQHAVAGLSYMDRCWEIYHLSCQPRSKAPFDPIMTLRQFLFLLKDLKILGPQLPTATVFNVMSADDPAVMNGNNYNVNMEITFLEFFEALIGCALAFTDVEPCVTDHVEDTHTFPPNSELAFSEHMEQETMSGSQHLGSNFELGAPAPLGGTGEFLQTLSQMTLHDEVGEAVEEPPILNEAEKEPEVHDPVLQQQQEFDDWNRTLSTFFFQTLFPAWGHLQMFKDELIKYRNSEAEKKRIKTLERKSTYMSVTSFHGNLEVAPCLSKISLKCEPEPIVPEIIPEPEPEPPKRGKSCGKRVKKEKK